jgi:hypothetical protein
MAAAAVLAAALVAIRAARGAILVSAGENRFGGDKRVIGLANHRDPQV